MEKFIVRLSLFGLAVALLAPVFPLVAVFIPLLMPIFMLLVFITIIVLLVGAIRSVLH
ncbi:MAG: hypothetical protein K9L60_14400 [Methylovulum sp.]|nr:hypothetical protein [Methylovulum sp.]MCF8000152.1 hypothetical protein [Methylovulum sp.]